MAVISGQSVTAEFTTRNVNGNRQDADSLPTGTFILNGADQSGVSVTVTKVATGRYKFQATTPTLAAGDICEVDILATVGGVTDSSIVWRDTRQDACVSDLATDYALASGVDVTKVNHDSAAAIAHQLILNKVFTGTVTGSPTTTTFIDTAQTAPDNAWWNGRILLFGGTLGGQGTLLTGWNSATKTFTFKALTRAPTIGDPYGIV